MTAITLESDSSHSPPAVCQCNERSSKDRPKTKRNQLIPGVAGGIRSRGGEKFPSRHGPERINSRNARASIKNTARTMASPVYPDMQTSFYEPQFVDCS